MAYDETKSRAEEAETIRVRGYAIGHHVHRLVQLLDESRGGVSSETCGDWFDEILEGVVEAQHDKRRDPNAEEYAILHAAAMKAFRPGAYSREEITNLGRKLDEAMSDYVGVSAERLAAERRETRALEIRTS